MRRALWNSASFGSPSALGRALVCPGPLAFHAQNGGQVFHRALIVTEAGGLVGNFTDEADFLHQREVVAGNPRLYGQLVQLLAPFSRAFGPAGKAPKAAAAPDATAAFVAAATDRNAPDTEPGPDAPPPRRRARHCGFAGPRQHRSGPAAAPGSTALRAAACRIG